ncbi:MAG: hypothetical protein JWM88_1818 [Verrucomicrobia bacterium]|nr:hypothetical protein [Verrucomicrobiota bacterium]
MFPSLRILGVLLLAGILAGGAVLRAGDPVRGAFAGGVKITDGLNAQQVQMIIVESAAGRGWTVLSRDAGKVTLKLDQDFWSAKLTLVYTTRDVQFYSNSVFGGRPKLPDAWLKSLKQDIAAKSGLWALSKR